MNVSCNVPPTGLFDDVDPSTVQTVTVYSVVGTLYTDFKDGTVLFTVELRITDRPSLSLYRPSGASSVKVP